MRRNKNIKLKTWEDAYYDGIVTDPRYEDFCEETQKVIKRKSNDGWDKYEDLEEDDIEWDD